tara:strand:+ start:214 stop:402 length:189 start_codon:yes stop_codon:yes gene_type:complete
MARKKPKYLISLYQTFGQKPTISIEVSGSKAEKIIDIIDTDILKHERILKYSLATLEPFFID